MQKDHRIHRLGLLVLLACFGFACNSQSPQNTPTQSQNQAPSLTPDIRDQKAGAYKLSQPQFRTLAAPLRESDEGVEVSGLRFSAGFDLDNDGAENRAMQSETAVDGFEKHKIHMNIEDFPIMAQQQDTFVITDKNTKSSLILKTDQDLFNYTLTKGKDEIKIKTTPSLTYTVNGQPAATPLAVAQLLIKEPLIKNTSIHSVAFLLVSVRAAAQRDALKWVDGDSSDMDEDLLDDIGNLVDESQLVKFKGDENLKKGLKINKDLYQGLKADKAFDSDEELGDEDEDDDMAVKAAPHKTAAQPFRISSASAGDFLFRRTLVPIHVSVAANNYGNPEPILEALLKLMKAERKS